MIRLRMTLLPYGSQLYAEEDLISATIWTMSKPPPRHCFSIRDNHGNELASGEVAKNQSGHRNPLHLLRDILATVDIDAWKSNYVTTPFDHDS